MSDKPDGLTALKAMCSIWEPVGSRVTCNPPPTDTDIDTLALLSDPSKMVDAIQCVTPDAVGFEFGGSIVEDPTRQTLRFVSLKRGNENIILTACPEFAKRFLAASHVAKRLNLLHKADRVALFQAVLYGNQWVEPIEQVHSPSCAVALNGRHECSCGATVSTPAPAPAVRACSSCVSYIAGSCWLHGVVVRGTTLGRECFQARRGGEASAEGVNHGT